MQDSGKAPIKKTVLAIVGSASQNSSNLKLIQHIALAMQERCRFTVYDKLSGLPHFDPQLSVENTPQAISHLRAQIADADAVLICTPEYIFSLPSGLKNVFEWCVSTTIFSGKPVGLITASAHGVKGHEELQRIVKTIEGKFTEETTLLIQGIKGKIDKEGVIVDAKTKAAIAYFIAAFARLIDIETKSLPTVEPD